MERSSSSLLGETSEKLRMLKTSKASLARSLPGGSMLDLEARRHRELLQRLDGWRAAVMVERYPHLAPDHLAQAANRLDPLLEGYDFATLEKGKGLATNANPL